jgi:hypothetical protein
MIWRSNRAVLSNILPLIHAQITWPYLLLAQLVGVSTLLHINLKVVWVQEENFMDPGSKLLSVRPCLRCMNTWHEDKSRGRHSTWVPFGTQGSPKREEPKCAAKKPPSRWMFDLFDMPRVSHQQRGRTGDGKEPVSMEFSSRKSKPRSLVWNSQHISPFA